MGKGWGLGMGKESQNFTRGGEGVWFYNFSVAFFFAILLNKVLLEF